jgi:hypothetical protein
MTSNLVAAREGSTAGEIGTKVLIGNFNVFPDVFRLHPEYWMSHKEKDPRSFA